MNRFPLFFLLVFLLSLPLSVPITAQIPSNEVFTNSSNEARTLMQQREYKQAVAVWTRLVKSTAGLSREQQAFVRLQRGICYVQIRADTSAMIDLTSSLELVPSAEAFYTRSGVYLRQKLFSFAMTDITHAITLVPDKAEYYLLRGNIHFQLTTKNDGCADIAMARILGLAFPDDISYEPCRLLGVAVEKNVRDSTEVEVAQNSATTTANSALQSLIVGTNNLNTGYYRWFLQAQYGGAGLMLSRLFYDVGSGNIGLVNVGYSVSRNLALWTGGFFSWMPYTQGSERLRISPQSVPPFGTVTFAGGLLGVQYSAVIDKNIDFQFGLGLGYKWTQYPSNIPITYTNGDIEFANRGIPSAHGAMAQVSLGAEWRILKNIALTGNLLLGMSFSQYHYYTIFRREQESIHQLVSYVGGLRLYFDEQSTQ
jgi:hypothetical protein